MDEGTACPRCGAISDDVSWCDVCGAELRTPEEATGWLDVDDIVSFPAPEPVDPDTTGGNTLTMRVSTESSPITLPPESRRLRVTSVEARFATRRILRLESDEGVTFRGDERAAQEIEPALAGAAGLESLIDAPIAATRRGDHVVRLYRDVPGELMSERLVAHGAPLTPAEVTEWMAPIVDAVSALHDAGYVCLRLCPYTIADTSAGGIFLRGVELLYPSDAALERLPAITGYTAPEVYDAEVGEPPGVAADIYMLAMLVYFLVTGHDPPATVYSGHLPLIGVRDHAPNLPLGFASVMSRLGAGDPEARPRSAAELYSLLLHARDRAAAPRMTLDELPFAVASETHVGIVKRLYVSENQDAVFSDAAPERDAALLLVADGVSTATYGSGAIASALTLDAVRRAWAGWLADPDAAAPSGSDAWLTAVIQRANDAIIETVNRDYAPFDREPSEVMGSTCVLALIHRGICHLASIGDSRAYLLRDNTIERITRDHNLRTLGVTQGLDPDVAATFPHGDALARCLGAGDFEGESLVSSTVEPDVYVFAMQPGDRLLLCTDGVTDFLAPEEQALEDILAQVLASGAIPEHVCLDLIYLANHAGGADNIGCSVAFAAPAFTDALAWYFAESGDSEAALEELEHIEEIDPD